MDTVAAPAPFLDIVVPGLPIAQPRHRARVMKSKSGDVFASLYLPKDATVNSFKATIRLRTSEIRGAFSPLLEGPLRVEIVATFPRPDSATKKTRTNPRFPHTGRPDGDNVAKAVLDALTGVLWSDDSQVAQLAIEKWTGEPGQAGETRIRVLPVAFETPTKIAAPRAVPQVIEKGLFPA